MTLAEALNKAEVTVGLEDGAVFLAAADGIEAENLDGYRVLQTNSGPDVRVDDSFWFVVYATDGSTTHTASFNPLMQKWE